MTGQQQILCSLEATRSISGCGLKTTCKWITLYTLLNTCSILLITYIPPLTLLDNFFAWIGLKAVFFGRQIVSLDLFSQRDYETTLFAFL